MLEKDLQKKCIDYLHSKGAYTVKVISANKSGVPDILACVPTVITPDMVGKKVGVFVGAEIKNPNGKGITSSLQKRNIKQIKQAGGISASDIICLEDLKELLNSL